ncbi:hypothetical protein OPV22_007890 [Ensete ventricosum]|uniref:FLZ-type domain-containing protein n=1 Tax=Ensete ventricosum TaxID=4639 RepID=A0AAV8RFA3_ENSVE|nr:hypothetical protein OPV22_007890 [Ensete ventricosum]
MTGPGFNKPSSIDLFPLFFRLRSLFLRRKNNGIDLLSWFLDQSPNLRRQFTFRQPIRPSRNVEQKKLEPFLPVLDDDDTGHHHGCKLVVDQVRSCKRCRHEVEDSSSYMIPGATRQEQRFGEEK